MRHLRLGEAGLPSPADARSICAPAALRGVECCAAKLHSTAGWWGCKRFRGRCAAGRAGWFAGGGSRCGYAGASQCCGFILGKEVLVSALKLFDDVLRDFGCAAGFGDAAPDALRRAALDCGLRPAAQRLGEAVNRSGIETIQNFLQRTALTLATLVRQLNR